MQSFQEKYVEEMICSIEAALFAWDQALNDIN